MRLAANDEPLTATARDDRLERARKLLRPAKKAAKRNTGPILASAGLAGAALLLASLMGGIPGGHVDAPQAPTSGSDVAPSGHALRDVVPSTPKADFELSADPGTVPAQATPPVRDAVLIGTEGEAR